MDFEKEDLIIPTFILVAVTFVWVTGNPSMDSTTVDEIYTFGLGTHEKWSEVYHREDIICTSETRMDKADMEFAIKTDDGYKLEMRESEDWVSPVGPGKCAVVREVEKTKFELYGFEVVL